MFQISTNGTSGWSWLATGSKALLLTADQEGKYIRSSSTGTDSIGQTAVANSAPVGPVVPLPVIGDVTATVFGNPYDVAAGSALTVLVQDPIPVAVQISGDAAVTYSWSVRGDATAQFSDPIGASTEVTIASEGVVTVQCNIQSIDETKSAAIQFFTVASMSVAEPEAY